MGKKNTNGAKVNNVTNATETAQIGANPLNLESINPVSGNSEPNAEPTTDNANDNGAKVIKVTANDFSVKSVGKYEFTDNQGKVTTFEVVETYHNSGKQLCSKGNIFNADGSIAKTLNGAVAVWKKYFGAEINHRAESTANVAIKKVLTDDELTAEITRRNAQIRGCFDRLNELIAKYTASTDNAVIMDAESITAKVAEIAKKENETRKEDAEKAKKANAEKKATNALKAKQSELSKLIANNDFEKAMELLKAMNANQESTEPAEEAK